MREITIKLYKFDELSEEAKNKAREWARNDDGMRSQWAFDNALEDAKEIGLDIHELDFDHGNSGELKISALECAQLIKKNHGPICETYKTMLRYWKGLNSNNETEIENSENEFLHDLLEDYRIMLDKDIEYAYSQEAIDEDIMVNEHEFTEKGELA